MGNLRPYSLLQGMTSANGVHNAITASSPHLAFLVRTRLRELQLHQRVATRLESSPASILLARLSTMQRASIHWSQERLLTHLSIVSVGQLSRPLIRASTILTPELGRGQCLEGATAIYQPTPLPSSPPKHSYPFTAQTLLRLSPTSPIPPKSSPVFQLRHTRRTFSASSTARGPIQAKSDQKALADRFAIMAATKIDGTAIAKSIREKIGAEILEKQKSNPRYKPSLRIIQGTSHLTLTPVSGLLGFLCCLV
jgi:hypothetical protein